MTTLSALLWRWDTETQDVQMVRLGDIQRGDMVLGYTEDMKLVWGWVRYGVFHDTPLPINLCSVFGAQLLPGAECVFGGCTLRADEISEGVWSRCDGVGHLAIDGAHYVVYDNVKVRCFQKFTESGK